MKVILQNQKLLQWNNFLYLDGIISHDANCTADAVCRIGLVSGIVTSLNKIWKAEYISKAIKVMCKTMMQSIVLYNSETWTVRSEDKQKLRVFFWDISVKIDLYLVPVPSQDKLGGLCQEEHPV